MTNYSFQQHKNVDVSIFQSIFQKNFKVFMKYVIIM